MQTLTLISTAQGCGEVSAPYMPPDFKVIPINLPRPSGQQMDIIKSAERIVLVVRSDSNVTHVANMIHYAGHAARSYGLIVETDAWKALQDTGVFERPRVAPPCFVIHPSVNDCRPSEERTADIRAFLTSR